MSAALLVIFAFAALALGKDLNLEQWTVAGAASGRS